MARLSTSGRGVALQSAAFLFLLSLNAALASQYPIRRFTTSEGLPDNGITSILQDSRGFVWFGTGGGIARFDGHRIAVYAPENGDVGDIDGSLIEDAAGDVWAVAPRHLIRFRGPDVKTAVRIQAPPAVTNERRLTKIVQDRDGAFWVGSQTGLFRFRPGQDRGGRFEPVDFVAQGRSNSVYAVLRDRRGALWILTADALYRFDANERSRVVATLRFGTSLLEDRAGNIWASTRETGLLHIDAGQTALVEPQVQTCTPSDGLPSVMTFVVFETADGRILVGGDQGVVERLAAFARLSPCAFRRSPDIPFPTHEVSVLYQDRDRNMWVGTHNGAFQVKSGGFVSYSPNDGLHNHKVQAVFESRGELFVVSGHVGISRFDGSRFQSVVANVVGAESSLGWAYNQNVLRDRRGDWWVCTERGLYRFPAVRNFSGLGAARPRVYRMADGLPSDAVFRIFEDSRGTIWISTLYGRPNDVLTSWDPARGIIRHKVAGDSYALPGGSPAAFREDSSGALWVGLWNGSLARLQGSRWAHFRASDGAPGDFIWDMLSARDGQLWVASSSGITRIRNPLADKPDFVTYQRRDGLASTEITCLAEDLVGRLYACTTKGVDRFDPHSFPGLVRHFSTDDGLPPAKPYVAARDTSGRLWFGSGEGLAAFRPDFEQGLKLDPIVLTAVRVRGVDRALPGWTGLRGIGFRASNNDLDFEFVSPSARGLILRYRHKLIGADENWSDPGENGALRYLNLSPGRYQLDIEATAADGARRRDTIASFEILPPLWRRWWALTLTGASAALLILAAHRYRLKRVLELERVRMRIATDLHDELGADLSRLAVLSESARVNGAPKEALGRIAEVSRQMLDATSDVVWAIHPRKDSLRELTQRMRDFAGDVFSSDNVKVSFSMPAQDLRIETDVRRQVFSIFKECLNNIARHSGASEVEVDLGVSRDHLILTVRDNGSGFPVDEVVASGRRHGVQGMRWRSAALGGRLDLQSGPGTGTVVQLRVPLRR